MRISINKGVVEKFKSVNVTLTLESQKELDTLGSLFNTASICAGFEKITGERIGPEIYKTLEQAGADIHCYVGSFSRN